MTWLEKTHGTRFELMRHFLATIFDSEMFSVRGQWGSIAIGAFAMTIPAGMILLESPSGRKLAVSLASAQSMAWTDRLSSLTLMISITAILALLAWQSLFPGRRDYLALAALPVRSRQIFAARFSCVLLMAAVITFILILPPAGAAPHPIKLASGEAWLPPSTAAARTVATAFGCLFIFFSLVGLQGLLINVLPAKWLARGTGYTQTFLLAAWLLIGLYSWFIPEWPAPSVPAMLRTWAWMPPVWFLGLHEKLGGGQDPFLLALAPRAVRATWMAVGFAALMYLTAAVRYRRLLIEGGEGLAPERMRERRWPRWFARNPRQEAILQFIAAVVSRSRVHRMVLMAYAGGGLALMVNAVLLGGPKQVLRFVLLYWPLGFCFVALAAIRHAFVMPAEWKANWIFRLTESPGRRDWMSAVERFVVVCVIAPVTLAPLPFSMLLLGAPLALRTTALQILVSLAVFEFLFYSWQQLPFTCSYVPGKTSLILQLGGWLVVMTMVVPMLARAVAALAQMPMVFVFYLPIFLAIWLWARHRRRDGWGEAPLIYEDTHDAPPDLGIREVGQALACPASDPQPEPSAPPPALRAFQTLTRAFPRDFQDSFAEEMNLAAQDSLGAAGAARLLADAALRLCAEYLSQFLRDLRYAFRALASSPGFTAVALVSLSLGICISTCAFSEMNGMVLRDLPGVARPEQLVATERPTSYPLYRRYRIRDDLFIDTAAYVASVPFGVNLHGRTVRVWGHLVTPSYFATFGARPALGTFDGAVASYRFWKQHLAADPAAVGRTLRINGRPVVITGIAAEEFLGATPMTPSDLWLPFPPDAAVIPALNAKALESPDLNVLTVVARLRAGETIASAEAALDAAARQFERDTGDPNRDRPGRRVALADGGKCIPLRPQEKPFFTSFFLIMAGLIMMIACANVANMMLARAASRRREIAVRLALGAGRARIVRQLLTESLLVSGAAGAIGAVASAWLMHGLSGLRMPTPIPVTYDFFQPDVHMLFFTIAVSLLTGVAFGLAPALQATRSDLTPALKEGGNVQVRRFRRISMRNLLMVSQMAGSLTLLVIVGYLSIGIQSTLGVQTGFNPANLYLVTLDPTRDGYTPERSAAFLPKLLERVQARPSVAAASLSVTVPVAMAIDRVTISLPARSLGSQIRHIVGKDYFAATGISILAGRGFRRQDETDESTAVIVTEAFAREFFPAADALGRTLEVGNGEVLPAKMMPGSFDYRPSAHTRARRTYEVIGVVSNVSEGLVSGKPKPVIYFPLRPSDMAEPSQLGVTLLVRTNPGADGVAIVRREIDALDTNVTPFYTGSMAQHIDEFMGMLRVASWTYALIGFFGLVLAAVGLAGMTAYSVASRNHEIGIRMALGAGRGSVLGLVMKEGATLVAAGTLLGGLGAWIASRGLAAISSEVGQVASTSANNPVVVFGSPLLLAAMALIACYIPALRSLKVDPVVALRQD